MSFTCLKPSRTRRRAWSGCAACARSPARAPGRAGAVGKPGQRVVVGERGDALARDGDLGDVAPDSAIADEHAVRVEARLAADREVARAPVGHDARTRNRGRAGGWLRHGAPPSPPGPGSRRRRPRDACRACRARLRRAIARAVHDARQVVLGVGLQEEVRGEVVRLRKRARSRAATPRRAFAAGTGRRGSRSPARPRSGARRARRRGARRREKADRAALRHRRKANVAKAPEASRGDFENTGLPSCHIARERVRNCSVEGSRANQPSSKPISPLAASTRKQRP